MVSLVRSSSILLTLCAWLASTPQAAAANRIVNSEFTVNTAGWSEVGTVFTTGQAAILSDQGGERVVLFQMVAVPVATTAALALSFDFFNSLSPLIGLGETPDSVFFTAFFGTALFGPIFENGVFDQSMELLDADYRGATNFPPGMVVAASPKGAGWTRYSLPVPVSPFVTVSFEFIEGNATTGDSTAAVDNVFLIAQPIPTAGAHLRKLQNQFQKKWRVSFLKATSTASIWARPLGDQNWPRRFNRS